MARKKVIIELSEQDRTSLQERVKSCHLTQLEIAQQLGMSQGAFNRAINGKGNDGFTPQRYNALVAILDIANKPARKAQRKTSTTSVQPKENLVHGILKCEDGYEDISNVDELIQLAHHYEAKIATAPIEVKSNGKPLMRDLLKDLHREMEKADEADVSSFTSFLKEHCELPLMVYGNGACTSARYLALLYSMFEGCGYSLTTYEANAYSDAALAKAKHVLVTSSGSGVDAPFLAEKLLQLCPQNTALLTRSNSRKTRFNKPIVNKTKRLFEEQGLVDNIFSFDNGEISNGFIAIRSMFFDLSVIYRAFFGGTVADKIHINPILKENFIYRLNDESVSSEYTLPSLTQIKNVVVLHGNYAKPIAYDLESKLVEGGVASVSVSDYRNFCHGRFIFLSNHVENEKNPIIKSDTVLVLLVTPREKHIVSDLLNNVVPPQFPIALIETDHEDALSTIDLLVKENAFACVFGEVHGFNLNSPLNYASIDKEYPRPSDAYMKDFKQYGCHRASWDGNDVESVTHKP